MHIWILAKVNFIPVAFDKMSTAKYLIIHFLSLRLTEDPNSVDILISDFHLSKLPQMRTVEFIFRYIVFSISIFLNSNDTESKGVSSPPPS